VSPKPPKPRTRCDDAVALQRHLSTAEECVRQLADDTRPTIERVLTPPSETLLAALQGAAECCEALELRLHKAQALNSSLSSSLSRHTQELVTRRLQLSRQGIQDDVVVQAVSSARYVLSRVQRIAKRGLDAWDRKPDFFSTVATFGGQSCAACECLREALEEIASPELDRAMRNVESIHKESKK
jgi:hypothetical protein